MSDINEQQVKPEYPQHDHFLELLVKAVETTECRFGLTLNVKGTVVSGRLISAQEYFERFGETMGAAFKEGDSAETIKEAFLQYSRMPMKEFIHLENSRLHQTFNSEPMPSSNQPGILWRGRLSEIDGYTLGELVSQTQ